MTPTLQASDLDVESTEDLTLGMRQSALYWQAQLPSNEAPQPKMMAAFHGDVADRLQSLSAQLAAVTEDRDSWRRVAERLEGEKQAEKARADKAEGEATKLQNYRQLHGGDVLSLSNDLAIEHEQVEELSAQLAAAERERDAARANAITFQQAAAAILNDKQSAEANLATANKQIEEMRGEKPVAWVVLLDYGNGHWSGEMLTDHLPSGKHGYKVIRPLFARTALSHEAHNG